MPPYIDMCDMTWCGVSVAEVAVVLGGDLAKGSFPVKGSYLSILRG